MTSRLRWYLEVGILWLLALAAALGASWLVHRQPWPSFVVVSLDVLIWVLFGSLLAGSWSYRSHAEHREMMERMRSRHRVSRPPFGTW